MVGRQFRQSSHVSHPFSQCSDSQTSANDSASGTNTSAAVIRIKQNNRMGIPYLRWLRIDNIATSNT